MIRTRTATRYAWLLLAIVSAHGCAQGAPLVAPTPSTANEATPEPLADAGSCDDLAARTVDALQDYVDVFTDVQPAALDELVATEQPRLGEIAADLRARSEALACEDLAATLEAELERLRGDSPVANSVAATVRAALLGTSDPSDPGAQDFLVEDAAQLRAAATRAGSGSVITLAPGTYALADTLVLLRPVTLRGQDAGGIELRSTAAGAAVLSLAPGVLALHDMTVSHDGPDPASVVVVQTGRLSLTGIEITGGRRGPDGAGGFGLVLQSPRDGDEDHVVQDTTFGDNEGGGVLVGAAATPVLRGITVTGSGGCGVCWTDGTGGRLDASTIADQDVALLLEGTAAPVITDVEVRSNGVGLTATGAGGFELRDSRFTDNETGLEIAGDGAPRVQGVDLTDTTATGVLLGGATGARLTGVDVTGVTEVGIVLTEDAAPVVAGLAVRTTGDAGIVSASSSTGSLTDLTLSGQRIGIQVEGDAAPVLGQVVLEDHGDVAVLLTGQSSPVLDDVTCSDQDTSVILLTGEATPELGDAIDCAVADQREDE